MVGALVQLPVGQPHALEDGCRGVGRTLRLSLNQLVDASIFAAIGLRLIPLDEHLPALVRSHDVQFRDRRRRILQRPAQRLYKMVLELFDAFPCEDARVEFDDP